MAGKRKNRNEPDDMTSREKKKLKMSIARTIATQAEPSQTTSQSRPIPTNSMAGMPSAIDVEKFVEARAFEIDAMHTAMKIASSTSTHRVWQTLPRHLRRRAASHDVRRVPLQLREKARAEMDSVRKKGRAVPKRGKDKHLSRTESLLKRQRDKMWLETHVWHAKRMHMKILWGYSLAISPTEKAYRPSHRASIQGAIMHDASYYSLAEIKGPETLLVTMLEMFCDPQGPGPGSKRCLGGSRTLDTHLYKPDSYPFDLIGPITIIWQALPQRSTEKSASNVKSSTLEENTHEKKPPDMLPASGQMTNRTVWLRFHPSVHLEVFETLEEAASRTLVKYKTNSGSQEVTMEVADLRRHVNVFEIMGPKSNQVIKGALSPVASENREEFLKFWTSLTNLQTAGSIPRGMIVGFKVNDPRLKFPPKNAKPKIHNSNMSSINMTLPSALLASSDIWDEAIRNRLAKPRFKKKDLDDRRSKNDIPGTRLDPLRQDDRIPVLLIQRSLASSSSDTEAIHGWTLIIPAGWSMAFFNSLIFTNTRVGGQLERQTQTYEAGTMYYPRDYPFTQAYDAYALDREIADKSTWERKPPAKRVNFEALGTRSPWRADWEVVLGASTQDEVHIGPNPPAFVTTQREIISEMNTVKPNIKPWLLRGSEVPRILSSISSVFNHGATVLLEINKLRLKRGLAPLSNDVKSANLLKGALINVKISMCSRGAPQDLAAIYSLSDDVCKKWEKALLLRASSGISFEDDTPQEAELSKIAPNPSSIIGYVTTGHYSLARGEGFAIGAISLVQLIELEQQSLRLHPNPKFHTKMLASLRNPDSDHSRAVYIEVISDS